MCILWTSFDQSPKSDTCVANRSRVKTVPLRWGCGLWSPPPSQVSSRTGLHWRTPGCPGANGAGNIPRKHDRLSGRPLLEPTGWPLHSLPPSSTKTGPVSSLRRGRGNQAAPSSPAPASRSGRKAAAQVRATGGKKSLASDLPHADSHLLINCPQ